MKRLHEYEIVYKHYKLKFLNIGAVITEFSYKGNNAVLSFEKKRSYRHNTTNMGSIVGRKAGRVRDGKIDNWQLPLNQDNKHTLHGGRKFQYKYYDVLIDKNIAVLKTVDKEGDFPGTAVVTITYQLTDNGLTQTIEATSDKPTLLDFTNHTYFNLDNSQSIFGHKLQIDSDTVLELDKDLLPVKEKDVTGTAFDFRNLHPIRDSFKQGDEQFTYTKFLDHPYKLNGSILLQSDIMQLTITTDCDYVVVYGGNYIGEEEQIINDNMDYDYSGVCLETQGRPGDTTLVTSYKAITNYKLGDID